MTSERPPSNAEPLAAPDYLPPAARARIFFYIGGLIVLLSFADPNGGLMDVPVTFFLKNRLHLSASEVATFRLMSAIPLYISFLFGLARDNWSPFGIGDRGWIAAFGAVSVALYLGFASIPVSYGSLLAAMMLLTSSFLFISSAQNGLLSTLGRQHAMSGQASAASNIFAAIPAVAALLIGGAFSELLETHAADGAARLLFLAGAAISALVSAYGLLRPAAVFEKLEAEHPERAQPIADLAILLKHRPIYPALLIWLLWNFAPGSTTPLQYYLQNTLHAADAAWGAWNAIFAASFVPTFLVFGVLCQRMKLRALLWIGTLIAVPQFVPLLFVNSATGALIAAAPIGLLGGIATAAYYDLIIRSCPRGLEGTTMMLSGGLYYVSSRFGDVLGTHIYEKAGGFGICVAMITAVYASILVVLLFVPREIVDYADGQIRPAKRGEIAA
ncbi:MAG: MFS transporter [Hyphomicrobiales bacterium]|nr:MFS transporter [Hyphomicrobiales bacterium]